MVYNEELHNLYCSPDVRMITSRRMIWVGHVVHIQNVVGKPEREDRPFRT
jgi:hypothetical protein